MVPLHGRAALRAGCPSGCYIFPSRLGPGATFTAEGGARAMCVCYEAGPARQNCPGDTPIGLRGVTRAELLDPCRARSVESGLRDGPRTERQGRCVRTR